MLRPSAYLTFALEGADVSTQTASAIKRAYSYVAPTTIVARRRPGEQQAPGTGAPCETAQPAEPGAQPEPAPAAPLSSIRLEVKLQGASPWSPDPAADETWEQVLMPWLATKLDKLFGTVREFNNERRASYSGSVRYATITLLVGGVPVRFELEDDSSLRAVRGPLDALRAWMRETGAAPEDMAVVDVPSDGARSDADWLDVTFADGRRTRIGAGPQA